MANVAVLAYEKSILAIRMCTSEIWKVMTKFQDKMVKIVFLKNFKNYISVANEHKRDAFLMKSILSSFH